MHNYKSDLTGIFCQTGTPVAISDEGFMERFHVDAPIRTRDFLTGIPESGQVLLSFCFLSKRNVLKTSNGVTIKPEFRHMSWKLNAGFSAQDN